MMHSPSPWRVKERQYVYAVIDSTGRDVCYQDVHPQANSGSVTSRGRTSSETFANAYLIAAAPRLLVALVLCRDRLAEWVNSGSLDEEDHAAVRIASKEIAKAMVASLNGTDTTEG